MLVEGGRTRCGPCPSFLLHNTRANPTMNCSVLQFPLGTSLSVCSGGQPRSEQGDMQCGLAEGQAQT